MLGKLLIGMVLVALGVGAYVTYKSIHHTAGLVETIGEEPPPPGRAEPPTTDTRKLYVGITPANATAEVDGVNVEVDHGVIAIVGPVGSVHHVKLTQGGRHSTSDVALTETGPVPPRLVLGGQRPP